MKYLPPGANEGERQLMVKRFENTAMCKKCEIIGSNYVADCPNMIEVKKDGETERVKCPAKQCFVYCLEFPRPQFEREGGNQNVTFSGAD